MVSILEQDITYLKGVGPNRAALLNSEAGIYSFKDLLYYFPYKYIDRSKFYSIKDIDTTLTFIQLKGKITSFRTEGKKYKQRLIADFTDGTGYIELIWFQGISWVLKNYKENKEYIVFGRPGIFKRSFSIAHPEMEDATNENEIIKTPLFPQYNTSEKLKNSYINSKTIHKLQKTLLAQVNGNIEETLPDYLIKKLNLLPLEKALFNIHFPENNKLLEKATLRLKFDELFFIQLNILKQKIGRDNEIQGLVFSKVGDFLNNFYNKKLNFELTAAQKRVIKEIRRDVGSGKQMNRLLQGDVGSGKTIVALMSMLIALDNNYQACIMAPTEILANQHYNTIIKLIENLQVNVRLLTGSTAQAERNIIHKELENGDLHILIGTHALIEDPVQFHNLGLVIIDEQHRFGVAQRAKLWKKNKSNPPHVLVMTATPIPRTLAMTLYGDLDVSVIDEMPPGRKPVQTAHYYDSKRLVMFNFLKKEIGKGRQVYVVYPLIKESEKMDYKDLEDGYSGIVQAFPPPKYFVSCVHGKLKQAEKETAMKHFIDGRAHILVATTVIEVGVDVPNASVMVIESAERFGLSQLHQLRGRVGRGNDQSYCILMTSNKLTNEAKKRLQTMVDTNDGFEIAEVDMHLRGFGDIEGTKQSGVPIELKLANLGRDGQIVQWARNVAEQILDDDPYLQKQQHKSLAMQLQKIKENKMNWSIIS